MTGKWYINGSDLFATYGAAITRGSYLDIMSPPVPRKRLEYNYYDENGAKVDIVTALKYEAKRFKIKLIITAESYSQFWTRYFSLLTAINKPGIFTLQIVDIGITVNLLYEGMQCISKPRSLRSGRVAVEYEISAFEPNPTVRTYS